MRKSILLGLCLLLADDSLTGQADFANLYQRARQRQDAGANGEGVLRAFRAAVRAFLRTSQDTPGYGRLLARAGHAAWTTEQYDLAAEWYGAGQRLAPMQDRAYCREWYLRALLAAGHRDKALDAWAGLRGKHPSLAHRMLVDPSLQLEWRKAADLRMRRKLKPGPGLLVFQDLAQVGTAGNPEYGAVAQANLGLSLRQLGRRKAAAEAYAKAAEMSPQTAWIRNDEGLLWKGTGDVERARKALAAAFALERPPGSGAAAINLAVLHLRRSGAAVARRAPEHPLPALLKVAAHRPRAPMTRRLLLDLLIRRSAGGVDAPGER